MKRATIVSLGVVGIVLAAVTILALTSARMARPVKAVAPNEVAITGYNFKPSPTRVKVGTNVTWTNRDIARHSIVVDGGQTETNLESKLFGQGQSYSYTFNMPGTYKYHCEPHPYMHGIIEVTP